MNSEAWKKTAAVEAADILLPAKGVDLEKFAVVACDQFTQDRAYWQRVYANADGVPSAAWLMLPEAFLEDGDTAARIDAINRTMRQYLDEGVFRELPHSMILTRRTFRSGKTRTGLVAAIDLEQYDFRPGSGSLVRATEATVLSRIPPRVAIRRGAALEMPHILILIDDPDRTVIEPLEATLPACRKPVYDFELNEGGGHIDGFVLRDKRAQAKVLRAIQKLGDPTLFRQKYGVSEDTPVLQLAVGDGNHSLATAKALYEETRSPLARYALAEIVNIHSPGIEFEPIHRVLMGAAPELVKSAAKAWFDKDLVICTGDRPVSKKARADYHKLSFVDGSERETWYVAKSRHLLAAGAITEFIDRFLADNPAAGVDYIHGDSEAAALATQPGNTAFLLPPMAKSDLFPTVIKYGALPRKTFSMGHAEEKRYYLECRKLGN
jgi:hypothetical protein